MSNPDQPQNPQGQPGLPPLKILTPEVLANVPLHMPKLQTKNLVTNDEDMFLFPEDMNKTRSTENKLSTWTGVAFLTGTFTGKYK